MVILNSYPRTTRSTNVNSQRIYSLYLKLYCRADQPCVSLAGTLLDHTFPVYSILQQLDEARPLAEYNSPFVLGETHSFSN